MTTTRRATIVVALLVAATVLLPAVVGVAQLTVAPPEAGDAGNGGVGGRLRPDAPVPAELRPSITAAVAACPRLTESWLAAVVSHESGFDPDAYADDANGGTWGLVQMNESLWHRYYGTGFSGDRDDDGTWDVREPGIHLRTAAEYFCDALDHIARWDDANRGASAAALDPLMQLVIYHNAGPGRLDDYPDIPAITQAFMTDVERKAAAWGVLETGSVAGCPSYPPGNGGWGGFSNGRIPLDELYPLPWQPEIRLRCDAAARFTALNEAFRGDLGSNLQVTDGYRSYERQVALARTKPGLAATPGHSNHGWGLAVDLGSGVQAGPGNAAYDWMVRNAGRFGWVHPEWATTSKYEPWHWEFGHFG